MNDTMFKTIKTVRNGINLEFIPIVKECTYYHKDEKGECRNCGGSRKYVDGYYLIYEKDGKKYGFSVDTLK